jgi:NAD+ kinase
MKKTFIFNRHNNPEIDATISEVKAALGSVDCLIVDNDEEADLIVVVGGDGAMLEAARKYCTYNSSQSEDFKVREILGINRGTIGFLASIGRGVSIQDSFTKLLNNQHRIIERFMIKTKVIRSSEIVFESIALNDFVITSPLSVVDLDIQVDSQSYITFRGSGVLIATPTGSTAYNLAAHGPIMTPESRSMIITELLDHSVPTPSLVLGDNQVITIKVGEFRRHEQLQMKNGEPADVILDADGAVIFSLQEHDTIEIVKADQTAKFITFSESNFFAQLKDKFNIK